MGSTAAEDLTIGYDVQLQTSQGAISGCVFAVDKPAGVVVLKEAGSHSGVSNLRVLKTSFIQAVLSSDKNPDFTDSKLPYIDVDRCKRREEKAIQQAQVEASRVGVGVTKEAQAIFDALVKTMPCIWRDKTIVVLDCVFVDEPYTEESCRSDADHQMTLERVKKVLSAERQRLALS